MCPSNSSKLSGLLSSADGRRKPYSTSVSFLDRSPWYIAPIWGIVMWDSSTMISRSSGKKSISVSGGSPGLPKFRCLE